MHRTHQSLCLLLFFPLLFFSFFASAQSLIPATSESPAVVTFTLDFPASQPEHYSIRVQSDSAGHYQSTGRTSSDSDDNDNGKDSFDLDFTVAASTRLKIFNLAAKAGYFQRGLDSPHKGLAFTGKKTLAYKDAQRSGESTYNYSSNSAVQELTTLLQSLAATLEFGRRLQYDHHYQKLALDEELKRMEEMSSDHELIEVTAIHPILDRIIADSSVMNVTRARAQRLLQGVTMH